MRKTFLLLTLGFAFTTFAQSESAGDVMNTLRKVNDYFMMKYADPTLPTNVNRVRPSSLWTRAVYYEGLMALYEIDNDQRYIDYTDRWGNFHKWTPRNGVKTNDADDQCCGQTYFDRYMQSGGDEKIKPILENLNNQMQTPNDKKPEAEGSLYGWWTWIDAIQMAMPVYMQAYKVTGERKYADHAMKMYLWTRNTLAGGLFNTKEGLWWRDKDYVAPYQTPDGKNCYWSRGNGWVYAAEEMPASGRRSVESQSRVIRRLWRQGNDRHRSFPLRHGMGHTEGLSQTGSLSSRLRPCLGGTRPRLCPSRRFPWLGPRHR